jgi:XTP/dITP diphosphohydrolase
VNQRAKLWCATTNPGKLREFRLAGADVEALPAMRDIPPSPEDGTTFEENAAQKAIYYSRFTDGLLFADDSGLEVDSLNGAPGVYSARYAGEHAGDAANNALLLERLEHHTDRAARFVCVIALAESGKLIRTFRGTVEGEILRAPRGEGGFGYDPLFFYPPFGQTLAEIPAENKFSVSHRGHALREMLAWLKGYYARA